MEICPNLSAALVAWQMKFTRTRDTLCFILDQPRRLTALRFRENILSLELTIDTHLGARRVRIPEMSAPRRSLELVVIAEQLGIVRLSANAQVPAWARAGKFFSITRTNGELSIACSRQNIPEDLRGNSEWRALKVRGPFALSEIGILSALSAPLAEASVSLFAISTFDTDYLLVQSEQLPQAVAALRRAGHTVRDCEQDI